MNPQIIALLLTAVSVLAVYGAWEYGRGLDLRRELAARSTRGYQERRLATALDRWDARLRRTTMGRRIARRIAASGLPIRLSIFVLGLTGVGLVLLVLLSQMLSPLLGLMAALLVGAGAFYYLRQQEDRRREEFIGQLPELARVLSNGTAAGLSIRTSLEMAAEEVDEPARTELARTAEALRLGQSFEEAMNDLRARLPSRELAILVSTLLVTARSGGTLISALRNISTTLELRKETRREVKTILGQSLAAGWTIAGMAAVLLAGIYLATPDTMQKMTHSVPGQALLIVAVGMIIGALLLIRRITRIDV